MTCRIVALDKSTGVSLVGIGETLFLTLAKLVMSAAGDQAETACGNLQLCAGLEAGIEGATHDVGHRILKRVRERRREEDPGSAEGEEETGGVDGLLHNLTIETAGTQEEAAEQLEATLEREVEEKS